MKVSKKNTIKEPPNEEIMPVLLRRIVSFWSLSLMGPKNGAVRDGRFLSWELQSQVISYLNKKYASPFLLLQIHMSEINTMHAQSGTNPEFLLEANTDLLWRHIH